ncbi:MAG: EAL domain-containing protein, partial [Moorea sp. SIO2B7]|nr:EAL domain-containing protein [Moorena sp. SIO2B7]
MQNTELARKKLMELPQMGLHISMDDFGTGYSSLGYLKKFPFHTLKIDQCFVRDLKDAPEDTAIIEAVMALARGLQMKVIAEGVETPQQLQLWQSLECEQMQDYLFSKPLTAKDCTKFLG